MGSSIKDIINSGRTLVSDGAWGTFLQAKGLKAGECPELWNIEHPDAVYEIAKSYLDAGSDLVETNSFGGNIFKLAAYGLSDKVYEINFQAANLSRKAAGTDKFVLGSVGPTGKMLIMEEVTEEELYEAFKEQSIALADGGADAIVIETMTALDEAVIAIKAAKQHTKCEVICTMTFDKLKDGSFRTMMGVSPTEMVESLVEAGVDILGANCSNGIEGMIEITREIRKIDQNIPILIHANAGLPHYENGCTVFPESPEMMANFAPLLQAAGANIIGGCCGTSPEHIRHIANSLNPVKD